MNIFNNEQKVILSAMAATVVVSSIYTFVFCMKERRKQKAFRDLTAEMTVVTESYDYKTASGKDQMDIVLGFIEKFFEIK